MKSEDTVFSKTKANGSSNIVTVGSTRLICSGGFAAYIWGVLRKLHFAHCVKKFLGWTSRQLVDLVGNGVCWYGELILASCSTINY